MKFTDTKIVVKAKCKESMEKNNRKHYRFVIKNKGLCYSFWVPDFVLESKDIDFENVKNYTFKHIIDFEINAFNFETKLVEKTHLSDLLTNHDDVQMIVKGRTQH